MLFMAFWRRKFYKPELPYLILDWPSAKYVTKATGLLVEVNASNVTMTVLYAFIKTQTFVLDAILITALIKIIYASLSLTIKNPAYRGSFGINQDFVKMVAISFI
jgi:hypothetical protein